MRVLQDYNIREYVLRQARDKFRLNSRLSGDRAEQALAYVSGCFGLVPATTSDQTVSGAASLLFECREKLL